MSDKPKDEKDPKNPREQKSPPQKDTSAAKSAAKSPPRSTVTTNPSASPDQSKPFSKIPGLASEFLKNKEKLEQLTKKGAFKIEEKQTSPKPIQDLDSITKNRTRDLAKFFDQKQKGSLEEAAKASRSGIDSLRVADDPMEFRKGLHKTSDILEELKPDSDDSKRTSAASALSTVSAVSTDTDVSVATTTSGSSAVSTLAASNRESVSTVQSLVDPKCKERLARQQMKYDQEIDKLKKNLKELLGKDDSELDEVLEPKPPKKPPPALLKKPHHMQRFVYPADRENIPQSEMRQAPFDREATQTQVQIGWQKVKFQAPTEMPPLEDLSACDWEESTGAPQRPIGVSQMASTAQSDEAEANFMRPKHNFYERREMIRSAAALESQNKNEKKSQYRSFSYLEAIAAKDEDEERLKPQTASYLPQTRSGTDFPASKEEDDLKKVGKTEKEEEWETLKEIPEPFPFLKGIEIVDEVFYDDDEDSDDYMENKPSIQHEPAVSQSASNSSTLAGDQEDDDEEWNRMVSENAKQLQEDMRIRSSLAREMESEMRDQDDVEETNSLYKEMRKRGQQREKEDEEAVASVMKSMLNKVETDVDYETGPFQLPYESNFANKCGSGDEESMSGMSDIFKSDLKPAPRDDPSQVETQTLRTEQFESTMPKDQSTTPNSQPMTFTAQPNKLMSIERLRQKRERNQTTVVKLPLKEEQKPKEPEQQAPIRQLINVTESSPKQTTFSPGDQSIKPSSIIGRNWQYGIPESNINKSDDSYDSWEDHNRRPRPKPKQQESPLSTKNVGNIETTTNTGFGRKNSWELSPDEDKKRAEKERKAKKAEEETRKRVGEASKKPLGEESFSPKDNVVPVLKRIEPVTFGREQPLAQHTPTLGASKTDESKGKETTADSSGQLNIAAVPIDTEEEYDSEDEPRTQQQNETRSSLTKSKRIHDFKKATLLNPVNKPTDDDEEEILEYKPKPPPLTQSLFTPNVVGNNPPPAPIPKIPVLKRYKNHYDEMLDPRSYFCEKLSIMRLFHKSPTNRFTEDELKKVFKEKMLDRREWLAAHTNRAFMLTRHQEDDLAARAQSMAHYLMNECKKVNESLYEYKVISHVVMSEYIRPGFLTSYSIFGDKLYDVHVNYVLMAENVYCLATLYLMFNLKDEKSKRQEQRNQ